MQQYHTLDKMQHPSIELEPCKRFCPFSILTSAADLIAEGITRQRKLDVADMGALAASIAEQRANEIETTNRQADELASQRIIEIAETADVAAGLVSEVAASGKLVVSLELVATQREEVIYGLEKAASGLRQLQLHVETVGSKTLQLLQNLIDGSIPAAHEVIELRNAMKGVEGLWQPINIESEIIKHVTEPELANDLIDMLVTRSDVVNDETNTSDKKQNAHVHTPLSLHVESLLELAHNWSWDSESLQQASGGKALSTLMYWVMRTTGLLDTFVVDDQRLVAFAEHVEMTYGKNPYHNNGHAANVLHMMFKMVTSPGVSPHHIDAIGMLSCIIGAVVHDLEHTGFTNEYLIATMHPLAITHNDTSPQEQHHVARASIMMGQCRFAFLQADTWKAVRRQVIPMVLATDMKRHFGVMSEFNTGVYGTSDAKKGNIIQQVLIKIADLSHLAAPWPVHLTWVNRLQQEYFLQGDAELAMGISVTPIMKRNRKGLLTSQTGFMDVVAIPMFEAFTVAFPSCVPIMEGIKGNYDCWRETDASE